MIKQFKYPEGSNTKEWRELFTLCRRAKPTCVYHALQVLKKKLFGWDNMNNLVKQ